MSKILIDTNLIIRFLTNDDPDKAVKVKKILTGKDSNILLDTVVAEIIWVLSSYYEQEKNSVIEKVRALIHIKTIRCNEALLDKSLTIWANHNISFIDSYIAANAELKNLKIYSYDFKFDEIATITRIEP